MTYVGAIISLVLVVLKLLDIFKKSWLLIVLPFLIGVFFDLLIFLIMLSLLGGSAVVHY